METRVTRNEDRRRYELTVDGRTVGVADFRPRGDAVELPHTEIDPSVRGRGYGAVLVRAVLDDLRQRGETVVPTCWYVAEFIDQHPEYGDLRAA